jgi:hypothetical protein
MNFGLAFAAYLPFVLIDSKKQLADEAGSQDPEVIKKYLEKESKAKATKKAKAKAKAA